MISHRDELNFMQRLGQLNWVLLLLTLLLGGIGIAMLYSASGGDWLPWAKAHSIRFSVGCVLMLAVAAMPLKFWYQSAYLWYGLGVVLLIVVEVMGQMGMGAQRWVNIGGMTIQPSEFIKLAVILALARFLHTLHPMDRKSLIWMIPPLVLIALPTVLILKQPNLGTATILVGISLAIWFAGGLLWRYVLLGLAGIAAVVPLSWNFLLHDYQKQRVMTFLDPESDPLGAGYNIIQSVIAIGSGGLEGKGFVKGSQGQLDFLPEKHTDFIFTMLAEEFGFIGCIGLLFIFTLLLGYAVAIAIRARQRFGGMVATGVAAMLWLHVMINTAMVMGLIPVVGVPMPFLSYGGTILLATCLAMGLLQNIYINRDTVLTRNS
ncbi:MAG: rod shape-determining protein RodA [Rickettsiales bacterium]|nr:rod shape-determining protein RodA [Rickettsiales bacterium]